MRQSGPLFREDSGLKELMAEERNDFSEWWGVARADRGGVTWALLGSVRACPCQRLVSVHSTDHGEYCSTYSGAH